MSEDNHTNIKSISSEAAEQLARKNHALDGTLLLTSTSNFGAGAGKAPTGNYAGFICGSTIPVISAITFNTKKHSFYDTQTINDLGLVAGQYIPLDGIVTLTITAGAMLLIKQGSY